MNILSLLTFYIINSQTQFLERNINNEIASSLLYVIEKFFTPRSSSFVFILSCQRQHTMNFYKDLMEILFGYLGDIKVQIEINNEVGSSSAPGERVYNLILVDSSESFLKLDLASKVQNYDTNEFYHIFLQNRDQFLSDDIQRILDYCWAHYIINANVQVQLGSGEILVYTYFPFAKTHCGKVVPVPINHFRNGSMEKEDLFPAKIANMHQCPIKVATWTSSAYMKVDLNKTGAESVNAFEGKLLGLISKRMNFEIQVLVPPNNEQRGIITGNQSTGAIGMLQKRQVDISLGYFWFTRDRALLATASFSYVQSSNVIALLTVTTNYDLLHSHWFPFKPVAVLALTIAFFATLITLVSLSRIEHGSSFFHDRMYHNIGLDHMASTLGLSTTMEPRRNWARIFIMTWMVFGLVIRTHYGAILFHIMKNNLLRKTPTTLEQTMALNYTVALNFAAYVALSKTSIFKETGLGHVVVPRTFTDDGGSLLYVEEHPDKRLLTIAPLEGVAQYISKYRRFGIFKILKESVMVQNSCMYFVKHSFLVDHVNLLLQRITSVGLTDAWMKEFFGYSYFHTARLPQQITIGMKELNSIFCICAIMLGVSLVVFCLEIVSIRVKFLAAFFRRL